MPIVNSSEESVYSICAKWQRMFVFTLLVSNERENRPHTDDDPGIINNPGES